MIDDSIQTNEQAAARTGAAQATGAVFVRPNHTARKVTRRATGLPPIL